MEGPRMGRSKIDEMDDWELAGPATGVTTLVLVGRTGNGKSATGNSILGRRAFKSRSRSSAVTLTSELQQVQMKDGRILNVVDTPGLFDLAVHPDFLGKEIVKCIDLAKHGVHGVLFVLSVRNRFTAEEAAALESLQMLFGEKILSYMVVTFTGGDELEDNQETLEDYLHDSPLELQDLLRQCNNRKVLFNNKATSKTVQAKQVNELLKQIDIIIAENGGRPYSNELFREVQERLSQQEDINSGGYSKEEIHHLKKQLENAYAEQLKQLTEMQPSQECHNSTLYCRLFYTPWREKMQIVIGVPPYFSPKNNEYFVLQFVVLEMKSYSPNQAKTPIHWKLRFDVVPKNPDIVSAYLVQ